ncbi:hypothetical protein PV327_004063 [Microctonus hyperodae]|uniref:Uncharacterized protein n=1 Tax=Microctonus hyperodae TaxID=165561 RepID=A0AA39KM72_MICHY|nr:hypothetical protein PV327_004063 [Microctonus hyperodae]
MVSRLKLTVPIPGSGNEHDTSAKADRLGLAGCEKFCRLMDISCSFLNKSTYDFYVDKIPDCVETVAESILLSAANAEKKLTCDENSVEDTTDGIVSGKILSAGSKIVDIATYVAFGTFNEGIAALLLFMHGMDLKLDGNSHEYARKEDECCILAAEKKLTLRLEKQEFITDKSIRLPWILPLQQNEL